MRIRTSRGYGIVAALCGIWLVNASFDRPAAAQSPHAALLGGIGQNPGAMGGFMTGAPGAANGPGFSPLFLPVPGGMGGGQMTPSQIAALEMMMMAGMAGGYGGVRTPFSMNPGMMNPGMMNPGMMNPGMMAGGGAPDMQPQQAAKRRRLRAPREPGKQKARVAKAKPAAKKRPRK